MIDFFANILGSLINFIYLIVKDYGIALIIFTIIVKCLTFFMTLKQKRDSIKSARVQKQIAEIEKKYKDDVVVANKKKIEVMQKEKLSPFSSCLFFIVQISLLFAMLSVVSYPLTYIKKTPKEKIEKYSNIIMQEEQKAKEVSEEKSKNENTNENKKETENKLEKNENINEKNQVSELKEENDSNKNLKENKNENPDEITENVVSNKNERMPKRRDSEIKVIQKFGDKDEDVKLNMSFLGIDLTKIPKNEIENLKNDFSFNNLKTFILPVAYVIVSIISSSVALKDMEKLSKTNKELEEEKKESKKEELDKNKVKDKEAVNDESFAATMAQTNKNMMYMTPFLMFMVTMVSPLAIALYWLMSSILSILETKLIDKIITKEKESNKNKLNSGDINV